MVYTYIMDKIKAIIEAKYWWRTDYLLVLEWAEMASDNGMAEVEIADYVIARLFDRAPVLGSTNA